MIRIIWISLGVYVLTASFLGLLLYLHLKTRRGKKHLRMFKMANLMRMLFILSFIITTIAVFLMRLFLGI